MCVFEMCVTPESVCKIPRVTYVENLKLFSISMERRTYSKLSSELIQLDTEMGFLACSVRVENSVTVEDYHVAGDFQEAITSQGGTDTFTIGFGD